MVSPFIIDVDQVDPERDFDEGVYMGACCFPSPPYQVINESYLADLPGTGYAWILDANTDGLFFLGYVEE